MVLGGEASSTWLGHEGGVFVHGISVFTKQSPWRPLAPSSLWGLGKTAVNQTPCRLTP